MPLYRIKYKDANEKLQNKEVEIKNDFWAEDLAYSLADKGWYKVHVRVLAPHTLAGEYWKEAFDCYTSGNRRFKMVDDFYVPCKKR